jgi:hypothetical protein
MGRVLKDWMFSVCAAVAILTMRTAIARAAPPPPQQSRTAEPKRWADEVMETLKSQRATARAPRPADSPQQGAKSGADTSTAGAGEGAKN